MRTPAFWYSKTPSWQAQMLAPLSWLYRLGLCVDRLRHTPYRADVPVISVGNLTAGGSGKTPLVMGLATALAAKGYQVAILTRGYGSTVRSKRVDTDDTAAQVGDEAVELFQALSANVAIWAGRDRVASAKQAVAEGATLLLLDDGLQHWKLARDADLLVISATHGLGNGKLIPAGPLREPITAAARVDAVVLMGDRPSGNDSMPRLLAKPLFHPKMAPEKIQPLLDKSVVAFCGLGLPDKFFKRLEVQGVRVVEGIKFADHHPYTDDEITKLRALAQARGAVLVTTAKDAARLSAAQRAGVIALAPRVEPESLKDLLTFIEGKIAR
ncbi:MAG: tetraacyldisaccharide 4'-kinase [Proteobacteria bacterium]|nr:tetraacyldisaccharide 4'-kinase [Pseudomonadota bacterium]